MHNSWRCRSLMIDIIYSTEPSNGFVVPWSSTGRFLVHPHPFTVFKSVGNTVNSWTGTSRFSMEPHLQGVTPIVNSSTGSVEAWVHILRSSLIVVFISCSEVIPILSLNSLKPQNLAPGNSESSFMRHSSIKREPDMSSTFCMEYSSSLIRRDSGKPIRTGAWKYRVSAGISC